MQATYKAKKAFKYDGKVYKVGDTWQPAGRKFDEVVKEHLVNLEVSKRQTRRKKVSDDTSSK